MLSVLFLFYGLVTAKKFTQIGLKEDCLNSANSPFLGLGRLIFVPQVSLKDAAVICVQWCSRTPQCHAAIAFWHEIQPACLLSAQRFLGFIQDKEMITNFEIPEKLVGEQPLRLPDNYDVRELDTHAKSSIYKSIHDRTYYAYNLFFPSCPKGHNLYPSRSLVEGLGLICDISRFGTLEEFDRVWKSLREKDSSLTWFWDTFRDAILLTFFHPMGNGVPSLLVGNTWWEKLDIVRMIRRILSKEPLDPSMVFAHAAATFRGSKFFSVSPETVTVDEIKQKGQILDIHQPFHLPDGNWVILKWNMWEAPNIVTVGSNLDSVLDIPVVHKFLQQVSIALGKATPFKVGSIMAYTNCVRGDEAFCALFLDSLPAPNVFSKYSNVQVPDDFRLWIALDFMQRFGLTADDIDTMGVTTAFEGDIDFTFET